MQQFSAPKLTRGMRQMQVRLGEPLEGYLRRLYETDGLTQIQIAAQLGVDVATVSRWMTALGIESRLFGPRRPEAVA